MGCACTTSHPLCTLRPCVPPGLHGGHPKTPRHLLWANGAHGPNPKAKQHRGTQRVHSDRLVLACTAMWSALFAHLCNGHVHIVAPTFGWGPTHAAMHTQWVHNGGSCCAWPKECTPCGAWRPCHPEGDHSLAGAAHHHPATWASCSCAPQWEKKSKNAKSAQSVQVATDVGRGQCNHTSAERGCLRAFCL